MPALVARSEYDGFCMTRTFAHHERHVNSFVRTSRNDFRRESSHKWSMARRGKPDGINWYLREWMDMTFPNPRGRQAKMSELTGWSKATTSQLYNNTQDYSPKLVNEAADALKAEPWELLMPPERAMAIRRIRSTAEEIVTLAHDAEERKTGTND